MKKALFFVVLAICLPAICVADGIGSLAAVGKSMDEAKKELAQETASFNSVKSAIENGALQKGLSRQAVWNQFGEPVVMNRDYATNRERWVYKPASSSFFEGARAYLFFDRNGILDEIKLTF